ncbi:PQQ-binding-like beta-propeller repeat protein [Alienimonas chondri]|uniref:Outer membrane protein assembly factor BamB n=1 Tax=Alienimonas chondri TaxID=2681879 RepID=A0ABX1V8Z9_9PLAN|nr:PQQ-binding-like beta-propeller repeat protein [Alienimonas chondri]NNJ24598.1 Outer membrane protein assembly factor BamB [Alienimonas chondri]
MTDDSISPPRDAAATDAPAASSPPSRSRGLGWTIGLWAIGFGLIAPLAAWMLADLLTDRDATVNSMVMLGAVSAAALAAVCWLWGYSGWSRGTRMTVTIAAASLAAGLLFLFPPQWDGAMQVSGFRYRYAPTAEERIAAFVAANPESASVADTTDAPPVVAGLDDWPGLLGPQRDGKVLDAAIGADWSVKPPETVWRHPVGPGWGGFSIVGDRCFTMEQRGEEETIACYDANTGAPLWSHGERTRFSRIAPNGGDGPASTPTFHDGAVYSMGATGVVTCLDARTGELRWKRDLFEEGNITWGLACSPLVVGDAVVVLPGAAAGEDSAAMGLDLSTGETLWASGDSPGSYSSPVEATIAGVPQILAFEADGVRGLSTEGETLWDVPWTNQPQVNAAVPIVSGDRVFLSSGYNTGAGLYEVSEDDGTGTADEVWRTPNRFKLKFNDAILHDGFVYGLDEGILSCIDVETGERMWKKGRYGFGQCLLLGTAEGPPMLLVTCENGDLALVAATPDDFEEIVRYSDATEETLLEGVCWNHAAYSRGRLYWRNGTEAVCVQLADENAAGDPPAPADPEAPEV